MALRKVVSHTFGESSNLRTPYTEVSLECGHRALLRGHVVPSNAYGGAKVIPCSTCGDLAEHRQNWFRWKAQYQLSHTRAGTGLAKGSVRVYRRAPESPSGVLLVGTLPDVPELADLLKEKFSPLSPTER